MAFELFDHVLITDKGVEGDIVDVYTNSNGQNIYTIQSRKEGYVNDPDAYNGEYPLYDCTKEQIKRF